MGGAFAQEGGTWSVSGEAAIGTIIDFTDDPISIGGHSIYGNVNLKLDYAKDNWTATIPLELRRDQGSVTIHGDAVIKYAGDKLALEFKGINYHSANMNADYKTDIFEFYFGLSNLQFAEASLFPDAQSNLSKLWGKMNIGENGVLGVNYLGEGFTWFRTSWVNVVSGYRFDSVNPVTGIAFKYDIADGLSAGVSWAGMFGAPVSLSSTLTNWSFGVKYDGAITASAILGIEPAIHFYAGAQYALDDLGLKLNFDVSGAFVDPLPINVGFKAVYGDGDMESADPWANLTLKLNVLGSATTFGFDFNIGYNYHKGDGGYDGLWAAAHASSASLSANALDDFWITTGYHGSIDPISFKVGLRLFGNTIGDFSIDLNAWAEANFKTDLADDWAFDVGLRLDIRNAITAFGLGFKFTPKLVWTIDGSTDMTFAYTVGSNNVLADSFTLNDHNFTIVLKVKF